MFPGLIVRESEPRVTSFPHPTVRALVGQDAIAPGLSLFGALVEGC